jgi:MFS family permease
VAAASNRWASAGSRGRGYYLEILVASFAGLLLEISYTRIASFKLFYYYTYLIIGLALLGIGSGGVLVAISGRLRRAATERIISWSLLSGAVSIGIGYVVVAYISLDDTAIWHYGTVGSVKNFALLLVICLALCLSFVAIGVIIATLFGRRPERVGALYFADLVGAGAACAVVVSLIGSIGPPATIFLAGLVLALAALRIELGRRSATIPLAAALVVIFAVVVAAPGILPEQRLVTGKVDVVTTKPMVSHWSPIFRVDGFNFPNGIALYHDGLLGSVVRPWNGDPATLGQLGYDKDPRSLPFAISGRSAHSVAIMGAAGGNETLASLYFGARHVDAVELNPATYSLVTGQLANYDGHLAQNPRVNYTQGDGRSFLARTGQHYDMLWYPAPDSYSATNAATAGAYVLSESYLYTTNALVDSLDHLRQGGVVAAQFGEYDFANKPNRTTRYVATARQALSQLGIKDPTRHILVATTPQGLSYGTLSTILVKKSAFTDTEIDRFVAGLGPASGSTLRYAPGRPYQPSPASRVITSTDDQLAAFYSSYPYDVRPVSDSRPFFWHFSSFDKVITNSTHSINAVDFENQLGERVLLLLLVVATLFATAFLVLPFVAIRDEWRRLPRKGRSALYFGALGFGFFFFEIALIQRLVLFLGYPTYSITVVLASLLIFTGVGALIADRVGIRGRASSPLLLGVIAGLTAFYWFGLPPLMSATQSVPLLGRATIAFAVLAPLGVCLGSFIPLGVRAVSELTTLQREYVAWAWAVNGFASVIGSVLATIVAMTYGFGVLLVLGLAMYVVALVALRALTRPSRTADAADPGGLEREDLAQVGVGWARREEAQSS